MTLLAVAIATAIAAAVTGPARPHSIAESAEPAAMSDAQIWRFAAVSVELCVLLAYALQIRRRGILGEEQSELSDECRQFRETLSEERSSLGRTRTENQWLHEACRQSSRTAAFNNIVRRLALAAPDGFVVAFEIAANGRCSLFAARGLSESSRQKLAESRTVGAELTRAGSCLEDRELRKSSFFQSLSAADRHRIRRSIHVICSPRIDGTRWVVATTALSSTHGDEGEQHSLLEGIMSAAAATRSEPLLSRSIDVPETSAAGEPSSPHDELRGIVDQLRETAGVDRVSFRMLRSGERFAADAVVSSERLVPRGIDQVWRGHELRLCRHFAASDGVATLDAPALRDMSLDTLVQAAAGTAVSLRSRRIGVLCLSSKAPLGDVAECERLVADAARRIEQALERLLVQAGDTSCPDVCTTADAALDDDRSLTTSATDSRTTSDSRGSTGSEFAAAGVPQESLASVTHELRAPMLGILGMTDLVLETNLNPEQRKYLGAVRSSSESLLQLVNDLLDASKLDAGGVEIESIPFELRPLLEETLLPFDLKAGEKGLRLSLEIDSSLAPRWIGDPLRLRQVVTNLVGNALKFTERGGVVVRVAADQGVGLRICVIDTGIGIPAERRDRIFQRYAQADSSISRRFGGTGLGLSIARQLVELMEGEISVQSEAGRGSTFSFSVRFRPERRGNEACASANPKAAGGIEAPTIVGPSPESWRRGRVLLVEDHEINQIVGRARLEEAGYAVVVAANGKEAVERWAADPFDVVLMDVQMPAMDGLAATAEIRRRESGSARHTRIVAMTACAGDAELAKCLQAGMDACLAKPLDTTVLESVIRGLQPPAQLSNALETAETSEAIPVLRPMDDAVLDVPRESQSLLREFLPMYLESSALLCRELCEAANAGDGRRVEAAAHRLNGGSSTLSLPRIAELAREIEFSARQSDLSSVALLVTQIERRLDELRAWGARQSPATARPEGSPDLRRRPFTVPTANTLPN